jgi:hypothetical protein
MRLKQIFELGGLPQVYTRCSAGIRRTPRMHVKPAYKQRPTWYFNCKFQSVGMCFGLKCTGRCEHRHGVGHWLRVTDWLCVRHWRGCGMSIERVLCMVGCMIGQVASCHDAEAGAAHRKGGNGEEYASNEHEDDASRPAVVITRRYVCILHAYSYLNGGMIMIQIECPSLPRICGR